MPLTAEQLDDRFRSHPPTDETRPRYGAVRAAEAVTACLVFRILAGGTMPTREEVDKQMRHFAGVIDAQAPDGADKDAAIRCVQLARMALNEASGVEGVRGREDEAIRMLAREADRELRRARWQANLAIACGFR